MTRPLPRTTPTTFFTTTASYRSSRETSSSTTVTGNDGTTIFFIPGNPGLIGYYHTFLCLLSEWLEQQQHDARTKTPGMHRSSSSSSSSAIDEPFQIYGCSLAGFGCCGYDHGEGEDEREEEKEKKEKTKSESKSKSKSRSKPKLYDLEEQIVFVQGLLEEFMCRHRHDSYCYVCATTTGVEASCGYRPESKSKHKVILVGHSVGSYIAMEVLRRHREKEKQEKKAYGNGSGDDINCSRSTSKSGPTTVDFDIVGGIMLFPTVVDIAKSVSGRKLTSLLYFVPQLAFIAGFLVRFLTFFFPDAVLRFLINVVMKSPPPETVETTLAFLKSENGVKEALYMASSEMQTITSDKWSDDIWGIPATPQEPLSKLFFYFGRNDHWVADRTRDEIIEFRGRRGGRGPEMFVCEDGLPHAFCLRHNDIMAKKVAAMVEGIRMATRR